MAVPELVVGPMDIDNSSELTRKLGVHNKAHKLLERHVKNFPPELAAWQVAQTDKERSAALDLDEVKKAALAVPSRDRFLADDDDVEAATVHVNSSGERAVVLLFRKKRSGRSAKGVISYDGLSSSIEAYERSQEPEGAPAAVVTDEESAAAVRAAEERVAALEAQLAEAESQAEVAADPEPFEGYAGLNAKDAIERIKEGGREEFGTAGLTRIRAYEEEHQNRSTVIAAVEDALAAPSQPEE